MVAAAGLLTGCRAGPLAIPVVAPVGLSGLSTQVCERLMAALPVSLDRGVNQRATAPYSPFVAAWGGHPAVVLRCGVPLPRAFQPAADLTVIDVGTGPVDWFAETRGSATTLTTVTRPVKVELTVPARYRADVVLGAITRVVVATTPN